MGRKEMKKFSWFNKSSFLIIVVILFILFLYWVRGALTSFILAGIIAYFLYPLVAYLEKRKKISRLWAIFIAYLVVGVFLIFLFMYLIPLLSQELSQLIDDVPYYAGELQKNITQLQRQYQQALVYDTTQRITEELITRGEFVVIQLAKRTTQLIVWLITSIVNLVIGLILAFYLLRDFQQIKSKIISLLPAKNREGAFLFLVEINRVIEGFIRGQLLVAIFVAVSTTIGLYWLQIEYALVIGMVAGIAGIIPYLGSIIGILPALVLALFKSPWLAFKVLILYLVIQQLEGSIIAPKVVGDRVGLHPLFIVLALLAGGQLLGIWGMLIAVPIAAIIKVLLNHLWVRLP